MRDFCYLEEAIPDQEYQIAFFGCFKIMSVSKTSAFRTSWRALAFPIFGVTMMATFRYGENLLLTIPPFFMYAPYIIAAIILIGSVFAALEYAEIVGLKLGEPLGTLVLTISVTIIEVAVLSVMISHGADDPTEAREAVFSAIMIVCNGLVGLCLLIGGYRNGEQELQPMGASAYLAVLIALSVLTLILPDFTTSSVGPTYTHSQMIFISILSVSLYAAFLFIQTVRHRSYFLDARAAVLGHSEATPTNKQTLFAVGGLIVSLIIVASLAENVIPAMEDGFNFLAIKNTNAITGAALAVLVLLPESMNAIRAASRNALQTALNSALGSAVATIGLTVPAVSAMSLLTGHEIVFGLERRDSAMLLLTLLISVVSFGAGRTNVLTGLVHIVVFAAYIFLLFVP